MLCFKIVRDACLSISKCLQEPVHQGGRSATPLTTDRALEMQLLRKPPSPSKEPIRQQYRRKPESIVEKRRSQVSPVEYQMHKYMVQKQKLNSRQSQSMEVLQQMLPPIHFLVLTELSVQIFDGTKKYYYQIRILVQDKQWTSIHLFGQLLQLSEQLEHTFHNKELLKQRLSAIGLNELPKLTQLHYSKYIESTLLKKVPEIQLWIDTLLKDSYLLNPHLLKSFRFPDGVIDMFKNFQVGIESNWVRKNKQKLQLEQENQKSQVLLYSRKSVLTYDIQRVQVECYSYERSLEIRSVQNYLIKFVVVVANQILEWECKKTWSEIKEMHHELEEIFGQSIHFFDVYLNEFEQAGITEKYQQVNKYLKALFGTKVYYCDVLFDFYGLLDHIRNE